MPPITQQSSRAGLITAVVIFAIYYGVDANRQREDLANLKGQYIPRALPDGFITSKEFDTLTALKEKPDANKYNLNSQMPAFTVATTIQNGLKSVVDPTAAD